MAKRDEASPHEAAAALEEALSSILRWATRSDVRRSLLSPDAAGLSTTDSWLLGRIADRGPLRLTDLAAWQEVDKSTMTAQVQRLERRGLVQRRSDPDDRRAVLAEATAKGRTMHATIKKQAITVFEGLVADWTAQDQGELARLMGKLVSRLQDRRELPDSPHATGAQAPHR